MNKKILITFICSSLILITPLTAVAKENKINNILTTESDIKGLIAQKHVLVNEILEKHGKILKETNSIGIIFDLLIFIVKVLYNILCYMIYYLVFIPLLIIFLIFYHSTTIYVFIN